MSTLTAVAAVTEDPQQPENPTATAPRPNTVRGAITQFAEELQWATSITDMNIAAGVLLEALAMFAMIN